MPASDKNAVNSNFSDDVVMYCKTGPDTSSDMELVWGSNKNDTSSYDLKLSCNISSSNEGQRKETFQNETKVKKKPVGFARADSGNRSSDFDFKLDSGD